METWKMPRRISPRSSCGSVSGALWQTAGRTAFLVLVFLPLAVLGWQLILQLAQGQMSAAELMIPSGRRLSLLLRSAVLAGTVALAASLAGILIASVLVQWNSGRPARLRWLLLVTVLLPPYVHAMAWDAFFARFFTGLWGIHVSGWIAAWWVESMAFLPLATGLALISLGSLPVQLIQMARLYRQEPAVFLRVMLPLAAPALMAGAGLIFLISLTDYAIPALYDLQVYALEIFADFSATNDPARALGLALPLLVATIAFVCASQGSLRSSAAEAGPAEQRENSSLLWPGWTAGLQVLALLLLFLQAMVPLMELLLKVGNWNNFTYAVLLARDEVIYTFIVSAATAALAVPLALAPARDLMAGNRRAPLWWLLVMVPLAVPASLVGIGLVAIWNQPWLNGLYGSRVMPILAAAARFTPLAVLLVFAQWRRVDPSLLDMGRVMQPSPFLGWVRVKLPLLKPGLQAAALVVFVMTMNELGATLLVAPPGYSTLTMRVYNLMHYGASASVAGICLLITVIGLAAGAACVFAMTEPGRRDGNTGE